MKRAVALTVVYTCAVALACELAGRVNFFTHHQLPFFSPASHLAYRFYPNLQPIVADNRRDGVRVLVLGGSTLNRGWSDFEVELHDQLSAVLGREVYVFNTSMPARTSRDAYFKYWYLRDKPFDLVILYNAVNELRTNNVPDALWRNDYSHYAWYDEANFYFAHFHWTRCPLILPFYLKHLTVKLNHKFIHRGHCIPYNSERVRFEWLPYGAIIKSAASYRQNFEKTLALAETKHEPVLLMTCAYYIPTTYSLERFQKGELDYAPVPSGKHPATPTELWGLPEHVDKGLRVHNAIIRELAQQHHTYFVDQDTLMGRQPQYFTDVCHFSAAGTQQFVRNMVAELARRHFAPPAVTVPSGSGR